MEFLYHVTGICKLTNGMEIKMKFRDITCDCCENNTKTAFLKCVFQYFFCPYYCEEKINLLYRIAVFMNKKNKKMFTKIFEYKILKKFNCHISGKSCIMPGLKIPHPVGIVIGSGVRAGSNLVLYQNVTLGQNKGQYPLIGDNVVIYAGAKVIGDITIGNNVVIGTNAVVTHDVEDDAIVCGITAKKLNARNFDN